MLTCGVREIRDANPIGFGLREYESPGLRCTPVVYATLEVEAVICARWRHDECRITEHLPSGGVGREPKGDASGRVDDALIGDGDRPAVWRQGRRWRELPAKSSVYC